jgi:hypothetical protein
MVVVVPVPVVVAPPGFRVKVHVPVAGRPVDSGSHEIANANTVMANTGRKN